MPTMGNSEISGGGRTLPSSMLAGMSCFRLASDRGESIFTSGPVKGEHSLP